MCHGHPEECRAAGKQSSGGRVAFFSSLFFPLSSFHRSPLADGRQTQVAKQLADDEYEDFPTIQEEIVCGADDVENGSKELSEATVVLAKGSAEDRPGAWDTLGEAVRIMAQNTAILLHIVYGAEIKKIFALSNYTDGKLKDLLKAIDGSPTGLYEKNPQLFVNKVQAAMQDVQKLAQGFEVLLSP